MGKRFVSVLLSFVILIVLIPSDGLITSAATTKTKEQAIAWLDSLVGTKIGSGQCVALIKAYYDWLGAPTPYGNGCDYVTNSLPSGWSRIKGASPQVGDILVWTEGYEGYGHVAICGGSNKYFHQNWGGYYVEVLSKSYTSGFSISSGKYHANYWGVIRPDWTDSQASPSITYENITPGNYFIRNKADGCYLNIAYGKDEDEVNIHTHAFGNYDSQVYHIYGVSNGYEMMPLCSQTRVVNPYADTVQSGKTVNLYQKSNESSQWWKFQPVGDGYVIRNVQNSNVCLTPYNYGIIVSEYTGSDNQIWFLEKACIINYDANGGNNAPTSKRVRDGYSFQIPAEHPTREGHTFLGWSTDANATIPTYEVGETYISNTNLTLYAIWKNNYPVVTLGDVSGDSNINAADALLVLQQAVKLVQLAPSAYQAADVNRDGTVNASDALLILQYTVGLITSFPTA